MTEAALHANKRILFYTLNISELISESWQPYLSLEEGIFLFLNRDCLATQQTFMLLFCLRAQKPTLPPDIQHLSFSCSQRFSTGDPPPTGNTATRGDILSPLRLGEMCALLALGGMLERMLLHIIQCIGLPPPAKSCLDQMPIILMLVGHGFSCRWWDVNRSHVGNFWEASLK